MTSKRWGKRKRALASNRSRANMRLDCSRRERDRLSPSDLPFLLCSSAFPLLSPWISAPWADLLLGGGKTLFKIHVIYLQLKRTRKRERKKKNLKILTPEIREALRAGGCQRLLQQPQCSAYLPTTLTDALILKASKQRNPKNRPRQVL